MRDGGAAISDAEFVERVRRGLAWRDRFRWPLIAFHLGLAAAVVGLGVAASEFVRAGAWPGLGVGFGVGLALGASLGMVAVHVAHGLVNALTRGGRAERLLVRYYDSVRGAGAEEAEPDGVLSSGDF